MHHRLTTGKNLVRLLVMSLVALSFFEAHPGVSMSSTPLGSKQTDRRAGTSAPAQLQGTVRHKSDVMSIPHRPYSRGMVLAFPWERFDAVTNQAEGVRRSLGGGIQFRVTDVLFTTHFTAAVPLDGDGRYALVLAQGRYAICLGNLGNSHPNPKAFPIHIYGCLEIEVKANERRRLDLFFGMGGVTST